MLEINDILLYCIVLYCIVFPLTEQAYDSIINVHVVHSGTNLSDHDPVILQMRAPHQTIKTSE